MPGVLRFGLWAIALLVALYVAVVVLAWAFQGRLIYPAPPASSDVPAGFEQVQYRTDDGIDITAGYRPARDGMPTLLFFHGNGASWQSTAFVTDRLVAQGYGVLAAEYRGYGGNAGTPSEDGLYRDGRAALFWLNQRGVMPGNVVLVGNSIGSGVATQLASEVSARALVLISPFASLTETAVRAMPWLPVRALLRDRYDNAAKFPDIAMPILILHDRMDTLIPIAQAEDLARSRTGVELITYSGWGHDLMVNEAVQDRIDAFLAVSGSKTASVTSVHVGLSKSQPKVP